jgi:iron complex outermembrane receptor protein
MALGPLAAPALAQNSASVQAPATAAEGAAIEAQTNAANVQTTTSRAVPVIDQGAIGDIVVTAERREVNVQRAPLTIQVLSGNELAKAGITDTLALQQVTTGVQIGANGANTQIFVRGVGSFSAGVSTSPGVAFNVDGVYVNQTFGTNGNFYDLARVEVLKGPQGTLYGRNATGGSINLITNQPVLGARTLDLNFEAGNYRLGHASGAINLPIGDKAALRAAFNIVNRDGYLSDGQNDDIEQSGRLRFKWKPDPNVTILLNGDYSHFGGQGGDYVFLPRRPGASPYESTTTPAANAYARNFGPLGPLLLQANPDVVQNTNLYNASAQVDIKLPFATLTVLPAYRHMDIDFGVHFNTRLQTIANIDQSTVEARLANSTAKFSWVVGGFYYHEKVDSLTLIRTSAIIVALANQNTIADPVSTSYAGFGQATYSVLPGLRLTGGLRYTYERKTNIGTSTNPYTGLVSESFGGRQTFSNVSYKAGAEFDLAPRSLLYASYSTGYKSGGFSNNVAPNEYGPEKLGAFEIGSKNRFFNNKLQFNISAFHWKYKSIQDSRPAFDSAGNLNLVTFNSGDATLYGGTIEIIARPTPHDTINLLGEYTHARYDSFAYTTPAPFFNPAASGCPVSGPFLPGATLPAKAGGSNVNGGIVPVYFNNCAGFQVARVPKFSGSADIAHDFDLSNGGKITLEGRVNYASSRWITIDFIPTERDKAYAIVDANLTYTARGDGFSVGLFGRNLTKSIYYSGGIESGVLPGLVAGNIGSPRTYGVRASFRFGS